MGDGGNLHVVVFPWLAFGHMIPFLELSKALARKGHKVSFLSTPRNIKRLPKIPPLLAHLVDFIELPLPQVEGLPDGAEATSDLPPEKVEYLKKACDGLEGAAARFFEVASPRPNWVIYDFAQHWMSNMAAKSSVPCAFFSVFSSFALAFYGPPEGLINTVRRTPEDFARVPEWIPFPSTIAYRFHEARSISAAACKINASGWSDSSRFGLSLQGCQAVFVRGCEEFDAEWLNLLRDLYKKDVVPVGLLPPLVPEIAHEDGGSEILKWLDQQKPKSVVYIAFGSEATISIEQIHELALGLELSQHPFLWALRKPRGLSDAVRILPEGFEDRTSGRGLVSTAWVPQINILAHKSIGGFLTHCGWSSYIEGLMFGHPFIGLPIFVDQGLNSRFICEKKMEVEVERQEDGFFTNGKVAKAIRTVMDEEDGKQLRTVTMQMSRIFANRDLQDHYVGGFISFLKEHKSL